jgi:hypothetical protein
MFLKTQIINKIFKKHVLKNIYHIKLRRPGLPDDIFTYQNPNFGKFWRAFE